MQDPGSDWNSPSEEWGNYEEPEPESPVPPQDSVPDAVKVGRPAFGGQEASVLYLFMMMLIIVL